MNNRIVEAIVKLLKVKSLVTLAMTGAFIALLFRSGDINPELLSLFSASYGAIMAYFFNKREKDGESE